MSDDGRGQGDSGRVPGGPEGCGGYRWIRGANGRKLACLNRPVARFPYEHGLRAAFRIIGGWAALALVHSLAFDLPPPYVLASLGVGVAALLLELVSTSEMVFDDRSACVRVETRFAGRFLVNYVVCDYRRIAAVALDVCRVQSRRGSWWGYTSVLVTDRGAVIPVTGRLDDLVEAAAFDTAFSNSRDIAARLDTRFAGPPGPRFYLSVERDDVRGAVILRYYEPGLMDYLYEISTALLTYGILVMIPSVIFARRAAGARRHVP